MPPWNWGDWYVPSKSILTSLSLLKQRPAPAERAERSEKCQRKACRHPFHPLKGSKNSVFTMILVA